MYKKFLALLIGLFLTFTFVFADGRTIKIKKTTPKNEADTEKAITLADRITYAEGEVFLQDNILTTKKGRAEVYLGQKNFIRLDKKTRVEFSPLKVWKGSVYVVVQTGIIRTQAGNKTFICGQGFHRVDVKNNKAEHFQDSRPIDSFGSWNLEREREISCLGYSPRRIVYSRYPGFYWWGYRYWSPWPLIWWQKNWYPRYYKRGSIIHKNQLRRK